ncbi:hypothetical protein PMAYCL1PPCAC_03322, partial [Pristionchus mayeri]
VRCRSLLLPSPRFLPRIHSGPGFHRTMSQRWMSEGIRLCEQFVHHREADGEKREESCKLRTEQNHRTSNFILHLGWMPFWVL